MDDGKNNPSKSKSSKNAAQKNKSCRDKVILFQSDFKI